VTTATSSASGVGEIAAMKAQQAQADGGEVWRSNFIDFQNRSAIAVGSLQKEDYFGERALLGQVGRERNVVSQQKWNGRL
jgi:hypothetical protein